MISKLAYTVLMVLVLAVFGSCNQGGTGEGGGDTGGAVTAGTSSAQGSGSTGSTTAPVAAGGWGNAPDISYKTFDGTTRNLSDHLGKPVVVNFWAAWCPPCKAEMPEFETIFKKYEGQFELIAITVDERNEPEAFFASNGYTYTGARSAQVNKYVEMSIPVTAFIDRQGNLVHKQTGMVSGEAFESFLKEIL